MPQELTWIANGAAIYDAPKGVGSSAYWLLGTVDPSATGVAAPIGSIFSRTSTGVLYSKIGPADTDWTAVIGTVGTVVQPPVLINSGSQANADTHVPTVPTTYEWTVSVFDSVTSAFKTSKVLAVYNGVSVTHVVYQNVGIGLINRVINVTLNTGTVELEIVNNGVNQVTAVVGRFPIIEI